MAKASEVELRRTVHAYDIKAEMIKFWIKAIKATNQYIYKYVLFPPLIPLKKPDEKNRMELGNIIYFFFFFYSFELLKFLLFSST